MSSGGSTGLEDFNCPVPSPFLLAPDFTEPPFFMAAYESSTRSQLGNTWWYKLSPKRKTSTKTHSCLNRPLPTKHASR